MKKLWMLAVLGCVSISNVRAQGPGTPVQAPPPQSTINSNERPPDSRPVSWDSLLPNIESDQKEIWTFPARIRRKKILFPTLGVLAVTAGFIALDPVESGYFRRSSTYSGFNSIFSSTATSLGIGFAPGLLYAEGLMRKDSYAQKTALLTAEAIADSELVDEVMKRAFSRVRPGALPSNGEFGDTWFETKGGLVNGSGGFPSGHAIAAFSVATVMARRYSNHHWVPWVAYGLAGVVAFSRLSLSAHFGADVFMGAALGYSISRFTVLRQ
jgi:membrane-associated phospholipid phosphatase